MADQVWILSVEGMSCQHCRMAIEKAVGDIPGVLKVEVDLAAKTVRVEGDGSVERNQVVAAIREAGYEVK